MMPASMRELPLCMNVTASMYVCMHACIHVCMYVCMHAYIYVCIHTYICMCVRVYASKHAYTRMRCIYCIRMHT